MTDKLRQGKFDSFTIISNGLIETELLTEHEKIVYIVIRKHLNQEKQVAFPGMATISREARLSKSQVIKAIKGLEEKGLLIVKRETTKYNEKKTNIYYFNDFSQLWEAKTIDELKEITTKTQRPLTDNEIIDRVMKIDKKKRQKLYNQLAKEFKKEREPETLSTYQSNNDSSTQSNNFNQANIIPSSKESQELERYTMGDIHQLFNYDIMLIDYPDKQRDINSVMNILYTAMNTTKSTIRIAGEDKPTMVVISKLMKLDKDSIMYVIENFSKQTERIKNAVPYILTMLYNAPEQFNFDIQNLALHHMAHWNEEEKSIEN